MKKKRPYFYFDAEHRLIPFTIINMRTPTELETAALNNAEDNKGGSSVALTIEYNGKNGENGGCIGMDIRTDETPDNEYPLLYAVLSWQGARALHEVLGHMLRLHEIDEEKL